MQKILIVGTCTRDIISGISYFGGAAGGIALSLGKIGVRAGLLSILGQDEFSKSYRLELQKMGVEIGLVKTIVNQIPTLEVISDKNSEKSRKFDDHGVYPVLESLTPSEKDLNGYSWMHVVNTPKKLADYLATDFKGNISYCPGSLFIRNPKSLSQALISKSKFIFCNKKEYLALSKMVNFNNLFKDSLSAVFVTNGAQGVTVYEFESEKMFPVKRIKALDTTGAGDVFFVGVMSEYLKQRTIEDGVKKGMQMSSDLIKKPGAVI